MSCVVYQQSCLLKAVVCKFNLNLGVKEICLAGFAFKILIQLEWQIKSEVLGKF